MQKLIKDRLKTIEQRRKRYRQLVLLTAFFSVIVAGGVIWGLGRSGIAMTGEATCGMKEHEHSDKCYEEVLVCDVAESEGHLHSEDCYKEEEVLICPEEESEEHSHSSDCYEKQAEMICRKEESEGHIHSEDCYVNELNCDVKEHAHEEDCYVDLKADIEKPSEWNQQYQDVKWKDAWGADLVIAAREQVGYKESTKNYQKTSDGVHKGYTRYGQFCDDAYADWDAAFVNFCIYYAGLSETDVFPNTTDTAKWYNKFKKINGSFLTSPNGYEPLTGDIIFFEKEGEETDFQMGIVASYDIEKKEIKVIEGNSGNAVKVNKYGTGDKYIRAYIKTTEIEKSYKGLKEDPEDTMDTEDPDGEDQEQTGDQKNETDGADEMDPNEENSDDKNAEDKTREDPEDTLQEEEDTGIDEQEDKEYICGKEEHAHDDTCYDENKELACDKEEHTHDEACVEKEEEEIPKVEEIEDKAPESPEESKEKKVIKDNTLYINDTFDYKIDSFKIAFHVKGKAVLPGQEEEDPAGEENLQKTEDSVKSSEGADEGETAASEDQSADEEKETASDDQTADGENAVKPQGTQQQEAADGGANDKEDENTVNIGEDSQPDNQASDDDENAGTKKHGTESVNEENVPEEDNALTAEKDGDKKEELEFKVEVLGRDSESYQSFADYARKEEEEGYEQILLQVMQYSMLYGEEELDLSECEVTAKITPTEELKDHVAESGKAAKEDPQAKGAASETSEDREGSSEGKTDKEIIISAYELDEDSQVELGAAVVNSDDLGKEIQAMTVSAKKGRMAVRAQTTPNPTFSVQYYANLDRVKRLEEIPAGADKNHYLPVIDTTGGNRPSNSPTQNLLYLTPENPYIGVGEKTKLSTENLLTEIYKERKNQTYYEQPNIDYMNALIRSDSYELKEIWVQRAVCGNETHVHKDSKCKDENDNLICGKEEHDHTTVCYKDEWEKYIYAEKLTHFTNRKENMNAETGVKPGDHSYILIDDGAVIRLVYDPTIDPNRNKSASFYDYDISDRNSNMDTKNGGINSAPRSGSGAKYAFGNANCGTDYGDVSWNGNKINARNRPTGQVDKVYAGCTFGMVKGVDDKGNIIFSDGISGPENLFGPDGAKGKTSYIGNLTFERNGDTYTLKTAQAEGLTSRADLDQFNHPKCGTRDPYMHIWTNNFWPMDGAGNGDIEFGKVNDSGKTNAGMALPVSDDGLAHNSFFGMYYDVKFDLSKDYVGPLEYYFFGDDDMWVFLDGKLVCDIGGIHSSVGEYVNLWDYLEKGSEGEHTLRFYYTERGASGSTCWMQFTLPSLTDTQQARPEDYGGLKVQKTVVQNGKEGLYQGDDEFTFTIKLRQKDNQTELLDDYAYTKYDKNGEVIESNLILTNGSSFTLKNGEYILVDYVPKGSYYTITETSGSVNLGGQNYDCDTDIRTEIIPAEASGQGPANNAGTSQPNVEGTVVSGQIESYKTATVVASYINSFDLYELPSTGGFGIYGLVSGGILLLLMAGIALTAYKRKYGEVLQR